LSATEPVLGQEYGRHNNATPCVVIAALELLDERVQPHGRSKHETVLMSCWQCWRSPALPPRTTLGQLRCSQSGHHHGPDPDAKYENPHATIAVPAPTRSGIVTLAPTSRMSNRGATAVVIDRARPSRPSVSSTVEKNEMRAERITIDGKTYEMR